MNFKALLKERLEARKSNYLKIDKNNFPMLKRLSSKSGIVWHELYYVNGNHYCTCLQIYDFPKYSFTGFIDYLTALSTEDVYVNADCEHVELAEFEKAVDRYIEKDDTKINLSRFQIFDNKKSRKRAAEINEFHSAILESGEEIKKMTLRVYVKAKTLETLQEKVTEIETKLGRHKMRGYIQTNNLQEDYRALTAIDNQAEKIVGVSTVTEMLMRSVVNLVGYHSPLIGYTANGLFAPNLFSFDKSSYSSVLMGGTGAGKSAILKLLFEGLVFRDDYVTQWIDIEREMVDFAKVNDIPVVSINEENTINLLQIFFVDNESSDNIIREVDVQNKVSSFINTFDSITQYERKQTLDELSTVLTEMYIPYLGRDFYEIPAEKWFRVEDIYMRVDSIMQEKTTMLRDEEMDYYNIKKGLNKMVLNYGNLFNRHTNVHFDLTKNLIFDVSFLKNNKDELLKSAYMSLLHGYLMQGAYLNKQRNYKYMRDNDIKITELKEPVFKHQVVIDETMQFAKSRSFLQNCVDLLKFQRKAFSGSFFVFHTSEDLNKDFKYQGDLLQELFGLCRNIFVGKIEAKSLAGLKDLIDNCTDYDLNVIREFEKGRNGEREFMYFTENKVKVKFTSILNKFQRDYFGGGS